MTRFRRFAHGTARAGILLLATAVPAAAQGTSATGVVSVIVTNAAGGAPLGDVRVLLSGATQALTLTDRRGVVRYSTCPPACIACACKKWDSRSASPKA